MYAMRVGKSLGEGGHGSIRTINRPGIVVKLFHTHSCLDWELFGNQLVWDGLPSEVLRRNTCLMDESSQSIRVKVDGVHMEGLLYRRIRGITMDGKRRRAQQNTWRTHTAFTSWAIDLIGVIDELHTRNIIHNDIKPSNVMVENGNPVILDFGISCQLTPEMDIRTENTTQLYMDPGTMCYRIKKQKKETNQNLETSPFDSVSLAYNRLRVKWKDFPWRQLDQVAQRNFGVSTYAEYASQQISLDTNVAAETRDIYALGLTLFEMCIQTFGFLVPSVEQLVVSCIRVGPDALKSMASLKDRASEACEA